MQENGSEHGGSAFPVGAHEIASEGGAWVVGTEPHRQKERLCSRKQRGFDRRQTHRSRWEKHRGASTSSTGQWNLTVSLMLITRHYQMEDHLTRGQRILVKVEELEAYLLRPTDVTGTCESKN